MIFGYGAFWGRRRRVAESPREILHSFDTLAIYEPLILIAEEEEAFQSLVASSSLFFYDTYR